MLKTFISTMLNTSMHKDIAWLTGQHYQGSGRKEKLTKDHGLMFTVVAWELFI